MRGTNGPVEPSFQPIRSTVQHNVKNCTLARTLCCLLIGPPSCTTSCFPVPCPSKTTASSENDWLRRIERIDGSNCLFCNSRCCGSMRLCWPDFCKNAMAQSQMFWTHFAIEGDSLTDVKYEGVVRLSREQVSRQKSVFTAAVGSKTWPTSGT